MSSPSGPSDVRDHHTHNAVKHRDGRPPWCNVCGLDVFYRKPERVGPLKRLDPPKHMADKEPDNEGSQVHE